MSFNDTVRSTFWEALADGDFCVWKCEDCGRRFFPPAPLCPHCQSEAVESNPVDGDGTLYAYTRLHKTAPGFDQPLVLGIVDVDGARILTRVAAAYDSLNVGQNVRLEPCEYDGPLDRGSRSEFPFFEASPTFET